MLYYRYFCVKLSFGVLPQEARKHFYGKMLAFQIPNILHKNGLVKHNPFTTCVVANISVVKPTIPLLVNSVVPQKFREYHSWNGTEREVFLVFQAIFKRENKKKDIMIHSNFYLIVLNDVCACTQLFWNSYTPSMNTISSCILTVKLTLPTVICF